MLPFRLLRLFFLLAPFSLPSLFCSDAHQTHPVALNSHVQSSLFSLARFLADALAQSSSLSATIPATESQAFASQSHSLRHGHGRKSYETSPRDPVVAFVNSALDLFPDLNVIVKEQDVLTDLAIPTSITCPLCELLVGRFDSMLVSNASLTVIEPVATVICEIIKPDCKDARGCADLCKGVISEFAVEFLSIGVTTVLSPAQLCYRLHMCDAPPPPPPLPHIVPVPSNCSDHTGERDWPAWRRITGLGTFVQISDIHVDLQYLPGALSVCDEPLCCRKFDGSGGNGSSAGLWGDYNCDTPLPTVESLFFHLSTLDPQPDFVLYTGDDPPHDIWSQSQHANLQAIQTVAAMMQKYLPDVPVFSAIGNHEAYPVNQYRGYPYDSWLYDSLASSWSPWMCADGVNTLRYGGYFTCRARPGLRVISLNTNVWAGPDNYWLFANRSDFTHQLDWLKDVLTQAESLNEKVIIIGHAVSQDWLDDFSVPFVSLVQRFQSTIINQFFGHSHTGSYQLFFDNTTNSSTPISVAYIGGSVTPFTDLNPGFRVYSYDRQMIADFASMSPSDPSPQVTQRTNARAGYVPIDLDSPPVPSSGLTLVRDFSVYWLDLNETNVLNVTDWSSHSYGAVQSYGLQSPLTPTVMLNLARRLRSDAKLFAVYLDHYYRSAKQNSPDNVVSITCAILSMTSSEYDQCCRDGGLLNHRKITHC